MHKNSFLAVPLLFAAGISCVVAASASPANATAAEFPIYKFGGFGSLGLSHSSQGEGDYVLNDSLPKGVGRSNEWGFSNNSRVAVHATAKFTPAIAAVLQVDSEYQADGTYRPKIEWMNVKYAFTPDFAMRIGRIPISTLIDSENYDVGYSYVWVNPPIDLYQLSIHSSDGVDVAYRSEFGEAVNTVKAIFGSKSNAREMRGIFEKLEYGSATFHASYQQRNSLILNRLVGIPEAWIRTSDLSVGASYDPGDWFVMSEWMQRRSTTKLSAMYVSGGYRIEEFTPYLTYSQIGQASFVSGFAAPTANAIQLANRSQSTVGVGARWDFTRNADLKVQYDRVKLGDNSNGYLINVPTGVTLNGSSFDVFTVVVDFVF